jgi:hypothetical protein
MTEMMATMQVPKLRIIKITTLQSDLTGHREDIEGLFITRVCLFIDVFCAALLIINGGFSQNPTCFFWIGFHVISNLNEIDDQNSQGNPSVPALE